MKREFNYPDTSVGSGRPTAGPYGENAKITGRPKTEPLELSSVRKRGFTLIELLVASVIMVIVTGAAFTLFKISATNEAHQQDLLTQSQNLRAALYAVARDIRMAGSGLPMIGSPVVHIYVDPALFDANTQAATPAGWFTYAGADTPGVRAIFGTNSGTDENKSDTLTIFRSEVESALPLGQLESTFTPGSSNTVVLQRQITEGEAFSSGDILAIADGQKAVIVQVTVPTSKEGDPTTELNLGPRFNPGSQTMPDNLQFPEGSMVYNLRDITFVTYYVDTDNHRLMANYHDVSLVDNDADGSNPHLVTVAENIEDFQVAYYFNPNQDPNPDPEISVPRLESGYVVRAVKMAMVSRAKGKSELNQEGAAVEIMGHTAKEEKGYTRRVLTEIIQLRNF